MQKKPTSVLRDPTVDPVYLAADVVASLIQPLPAGTAYFIGVVLLTMMTGRLVQCKAGVRSPEMRHLITEYGIIV